ncbi:uncharacterized protein LOC107366092 [Tetranychus urticae]|uniref:uncharacterized protein LOC107366092 n=1 Tax=Tetranychus urticae TaxID=32264 RepID=UPI00077B8E1B|nr:uncharacterized protein LOC107366092 [Tetranychus urticae]XP_025017455.1 uncharacterized protein LOC107366092 [Tetranychus urticae]XP_025017456.1 uncharacterized protein LOC107366092 [Tetranychus urticae]XP_025017457.1 uncharacterized protein LOC107366092 [Tetranychus urticae]
MSSSSSSLAITKVYDVKQFYQFIEDKYKRKFKNTAVESIFSAFNIVKLKPGFTIDNDPGLGITKNLCNLCDQLAVEPYKCYNCDRLYCKLCSHFMVIVNKITKNESILGINDSYLENLAFNCISHNCNSQQILKRVSSDREFDSEIITVNCIYNNCKEKRFYSLMIDHISNCKLQSNVFKFDQSYIADTFINIMDPILKQDDLMVKFLSTITTGDENHCNQTAQDVYKQTFISSFERQHKNLIQQKERIEGLQKQIDEKRANSAKQINNQQVKRPSYSYPSKNANKCINNDRPSKRVRESSSVASECYSIVDWGDWNKPIMNNNDVNEKQMKSSITHPINHEPNQIQVKSVISKPAITDIEIEDIDDVLSTNLDAYQPDSKSGPKTKQSMEYSDLLKRKFHDYQRRHSVERNKKTRIRRDVAYDSIKAEFCVKQLEMIKPPQHFAWLIAKNNVQLHQDSLNACSIDIENLTLRVKTSSNQTSKIQVPCWISIVDSSGEIIFNEFIKHPKSAIEDFMTEHHNITWVQLKYAPTFYHVRKRIITILRKYKRIIVSGQAQDFKNLFINPNDHDYLLPRIICISSYYNCRSNSPQLGLKYCIFTLFGKITQSREHSSLVDAAYTMYLYLIDYQRIEQTRIKWLSTQPVRIHGLYQGYVYPKNHYMSGLINDIMNYIDDWPNPLKNDVALKHYMSKTRRQEKLNNRSYDETNFVEPIPNHDRPIPYKFNEAKFRYLCRPRT